MEKTRDDFAREAGKLLAVSYTHLDVYKRQVTDRMDLDTTQNKGAHNQILERFAKGQTQILIGTQMVAKGLDFPNVTTVGVLAADMILNLPDYTAAELSLIHIY